MCVCVCVLSNNVHVCQTMCALQIAMGIYIL